MQINKNDETEILLVEDNETDVELTLRALGKYNLVNKVHVERDGASALDFIFNKGKYVGSNISATLKLVILDIKLPKLNGFEVLSELKSNEATKPIPVVVLTTSNQEEDIVNSYKLGVNGYIVKPIDFQKFSEDVSELGQYWMLVNKTASISDSKFGVKNAKR